VRLRDALFRGTAASLLCLAGSFALAGAPPDARDSPENPAPDARAEAEEGLRRYQARDFAAAEEHFEKSLRLDPSSVETLFLLARTLQARFRTSGEEAERSDLAGRAMAAYEQVLLRDPGRTEAYQALLALSRDADDAVALPWLEKQAANTALPADRRADAFGALAARGRACAERVLQEISAQPALIGAGEAARDCATRGLSAIEEALRLLPQRGSLWSEQARLYATLAQVCALQGQDAQGAAYEKQAAESRRKAEQIRASGAREGTPRRSY
jgi:tetratricopeptide (TPR) repeat protein